MTYPRQRFDRLARKKRGYEMRDHFAGQCVFKVKLNARKIKSNLYGDIRYRR